MDPCSDEAMEIYKCECKPGASRLKMKPGDNLAKCCGKPKVHCIDTCCPEGSGCAPKYFVYEDENGEPQRLNSTGTGVCCDSPESVCQIGVYGSTCCSKDKGCEPGVGCCPKIDGVYPPVLTDEDVKNCLEIKTDTDCKYKGSKCEDGQMCCNGECCLEGQECCGNVCRDPCPEGEVRNNTTCVCECSPGLVRCGGVCVVPTVCDSSQCLQPTADQCSCESTCSSGQTCNNGTCEGCSDEEKKYVQVNYTPEAKEPGLWETITGAAVACKNVFDTSISNKYSIKEACCPKTYDVKLDKVNEIEFKALATYSEVTCYVVKEEIYKCVCEEPKTKCGKKCCSEGETCVNGECCPDAKACEDKCCSEGETCVNGECCPDARACEDHCCSEQMVCRSGSCQCPVEAPNLCGDTCCAGGCDGDKCAEECEGGYLVPNYVNGVGVSGKVCCHVEPSFDKSYEQNQCGEEYPLCLVKTTDIDTYGVFGAVNGSCCGGQTLDDHGELVKGAGGELHWDDHSTFSTSYVILDNNGYYCGKQESVTSWYDTGVLMKTIRYGFYVNSSTYKEEKEVIDYGVPFSSSSKICTSSSGDPRLGSCTENTTYH
jgi:hypothetical protein